MRIALTACMLFLATSALLAQQGASPTVSLQLSEVDITEAFATLSQQSGMSILGDSTVKGKVTCSLTGLAGEQALDTICRMNKLEWRKAYTDASESGKLSASAMFKALEVLKALSTSSLICTDPATKSPIVFVQDAGSVDTSALASSLKLKEVYIVRAIPSESSAKADERSDKKTDRRSDKSKDETGEKRELSEEDLKRAAFSDPATAAEDLWGVFEEMPVEQQYRTLEQLRREFYQNMSPQERRDFKEYLQQLAKQKQQQQKQQPPKPPKPPKPKPRP